MMRDSAIRHKTLYDISYELYEIPYELYEIPYELYEIPYRPRPAILYPRR